MDRALPWPWPLFRATMTVGRQKRSTIRDATMPITPACQPSAASTRARYRSSAQPLDSIWVRACSRILLLDGLAVAVLGFEINGDFTCTGFARRGEHLDGQCRMTEPAAGVEPWGQEKTDVITFQIPAREVGGFDQVRGCR